MMDKLPTKQELRFRRERKDLHERLVAVIRGLATKFDHPVDPMHFLQYLDFLQPSSNQDESILPYASPRGQISCVGNKSHCVFAEVSHVILAFWKFIAGESGFKRHTRAVREGIERLEWLQDNWDNLIVSGNLKDGYELEIKQ